MKNYNVIIRDEIGFILFDETIQANDFLDAIEKSRNIAKENKWKFPKINVKIKK